MYIWQSYNFFQATTVLYDTGEFIRHRNRVEEALFKALTQRVNDACCSLTCPDEGFCDTGCIPWEGCKNHGLYLRVSYFQLLDINVPSEVRERSMKAVVLEIVAERVLFEQQSAIVEKETEVIVRISWYNMSLYYLSLIFSLLNHVIGNKLALFKNNASASVIYIFIN